MLKRLKKCVIWGAFALLLAFVLNWIYPGDSAGAGQTAGVLTFGLYLLWERLQGWRRRADEPPSGVEREESRNS